MQNTKTILISGASGFLGKELIKQYGELENINVIALTSNKLKLKRYSLAFKNLIVIDNAEWIVSPKKIDVLINCAFSRSLNGEELVDSIHFSSKLIESSISSGLRSLINMSSQSVYSQKRNVPAKENSKIVPENLYAMAKYANELIISEKCKVNDILFSHIRLGSLVGVGFEKRLINRMIEDAFEKKKLSVNGGQQILSYLAVQDAASAIIKFSLTDNKKWDKVYNLGTNEYYTLYDIAEIIKDTVKNYQLAEVEMQVDKNPKAHLNISLDCDKFYNQFNWAPKYNLQSTIEDIAKSLASKYC